MLIRSFLLFALGALALDPAAAAVAATARAETSPFQLVQTFIRHIGAFEEDRTQAMKDMAADKTDFASCVRNNTTFQMDLRSAISFYRSARLSKNNLVADFPPMVADVLEQKIKIIDNLTRACQSFMVPDPKVDYNELARNAPKLTAMSEYTDKTLFPASAGIFASLISQRPDSKNHLSHLVITRAQRDELLSDLTSHFGEKLTMAGGQIPYLIAIAQLYRDKLNEYKCADEPWE